MSISPPVFLSEPVASALPLIGWTEAGEARCARWRSERGAPAPRRVMLADDTMNADTAYRLACEGTGLLWRGDFQNARQLVQALARRIDKPPKASKQARVARKKAAVETISGVPAGQAFHLHRQAQSQRARVLGMVLIEFGADYSVALRRAPDATQACTEAWGPADAAAGGSDGAGDSGGSVASLRELMGVISAHEWRKKGVEIPALGKAPNNRIHPHYGVFSPVRGEYVDLVANAPLPAKRPAKFVAFDIGTGTGVLSAVLALREDIDQVVATDMDPRALACARENIYKLRLPNPVKVMQADLFPEGQASVIVCNPPWLPARPSSPLEGAVYDEGSRMLLGFLKGLAAHLAPGGEGWLILSDLAEHLGLRTRAELLAAIEASGLKVLGRIDARPDHPKAADESNPLHTARAAEVTSLWRLGAA
ncbi:MAG: class I SAM-dependent methyltransferase [Pseudomonadota bacterium]|nr:class I SAM-dependent methyltransferase [Pseudomonadota bacterium]